jgi:hypothetical protein
MVDRKVKDEDNASPEAASERNAARVTPRAEAGRGEGPRVKEQGACKSGLRCPRTRGRHRRSVSIEVRSRVTIEFGAGGSGVRRRRASRRVRIGPPGKKCRPRSQTVAYLLLRGGAIFFLLALLGKALGMSDKAPACRRRGRSDAERDECS